MSQRLHASPITIEEYLAGEHNAAIRHEFVAGQVYAMAGASDRHNRIAGNLYAALTTRLDGPCEPFISDMKLYVAPDLFYYPDVMVSCDDPVTDPYFRTHPILLIEVVSPTTERTDRREKLSAYLSIPSLQEYLLIMQDRIEVKFHRRGENRWQEEFYRDIADNVRFDSVGLTLSVETIYRNVRFVN